MKQVQAPLSTPVRDTGRHPIWGCSLIALRLLGAVLVILSLAVAYLAGMMLNALTVLLMIMAPATLLSRLWHAYRGHLEYGLVKHPLRRELRPYLLQCLNRWMFWGMTAVTVSLSLVPIQFEPEEFRAIGIMIAVLVVILVMLQLIPPRRVRLLGNLTYAAVWLFLAVEWLRVLSPQPSSEGVVISPPFRGEWYVFQGGRSSLINHHYPIPGQRYALDLVKLVEGRERKGDPQRLVSYAAFGEPLLAPADGKVIRVVNDRPDETIGESDEQQIAGNHVIIEIAKGRYVLMAHLLKGSVTVSEGEQISLGEQVARCGNSGNTSAPHLHLQVQSGPDFNADDLKTYPIVFQSIELVRRNGYSRGTLGDLRRNDRIVPLQKPQ